MSDFLQNASPSSFTSSFRFCPGPGQSGPDKRCLAPPTFGKVLHCCGKINGSETMKGGWIISKGRCPSVLLMLDYPGGETIDLRMLPPRLCLGAGTS